jgi:uncharacterized protein (DUF2249 family)
MNTPTIEKLVILDVRPGLAKGIDPFQEIMATKQELADDETLKIINTFEPIPLINKFKAMGYQSWTERPEEGVIHTFFKKESGGQADELPNVETFEGTDFQQKLTSFCDRINKIDVRQLEMPEPMVNILKELENLEPDHALFVEHKKMPQFLLPELKDRNYSIISNEINEDHLQLLIFRAD